MDQSSYPIPQESMAPSQISSIIDNNLNNLQPSGSRETSSDEYLSKIDEIAGFIRLGKFSECISII